MDFELPKIKRASRIKKAASEVFDIAIIGGGIHGACLAREAAFLGLNVILLEARDYGFGTSSRSSKLLHGGLRYLEQGNISLVREALIERAIVFSQAPHLVRPLEFFFPIIKGLTRPGWQVKLGLTLYDQLAKNFTPNVLNPYNELFRNNRTISQDSSEASFLRSLGLKFSGLYSYFDAQVDDARLVIENIKDATLLGAVTLNYAKVLKAKRTNSSKNSASLHNWEINWGDTINKSEYQTYAKCLVNLAGPWSPELQQIIEGSQNQNFHPLFSRGSHLIFNCPWHVGGLFLPTGERGRNYWILPLFAHFGSYTLVGTTDVRTAQNEENPVAPKNEINELLGFLKRDLKNNPFSENNLITSFAGMRLLAGASFKGRSSTISRSEVILTEKHYFTLLGGKLTTARNTALKILRLIFRDLKINHSPLNQFGSSSLRPLPGGQGYSSTEKEKIKQDLLAVALRTNSLPANEITALIDACISRFGTAATQITKLRENSETLELTALPCALLEEIRFSILEEQALTIEDILRRRLGLSFTISQGTGIIGQIARELSTLADRKQLELENEIENLT